MTNVISFFIEYKNNIENIWIEIVRSNQKEQEPTENRNEMTLCIIIEFNVDPSLILLSISVKLTFSSKKTIHKFEFNCFASIIIINPYTKMNILITFPKTRKMFGFSIHQNRYLIYLYCPTKTISVI